MTTTKPQKFIRGVAMGDIYFVESANLYVSVTDGVLADIQRGNSRSINPHAIVVATFDATFDAIHAADGRLYLDGFALSGQSGLTNLPITDASSAVSIGMIHDFMALTKTIDH